VEIFAKHLKAVERPQVTFKEGFDINKHIRASRQGDVTIAEFIGTGSFASQFYERQRYEFDAGREAEPLLYQMLYTEIVDASLPRLVRVNTLGTTGVIFEEVKEGGEVKFASVGEGSKSVEIKHYAVGLEYDEDLVIYNELWRLPLIERRFGIAHNALLNNIHLSPIISYSYTGGNQTDGTALTSFKAAASMPEKYLRALEAAISNAAEDTTNPRPGPYVLMVRSSDMFTFERALLRSPQQGFSLQSSAMDQIAGLIAYNGWTGTRGKKTVSYAGVPSGKAYLIDISNRDMDFQSYVKQPLRRQLGEKDSSRFILEQVIWDSRFGVFADPARAVEELTLPTADSGDS
jgi:hypothetical protein